MNSIQVQFHRGGVQLPELGIWLDAHHRVSGPELAFISHAHSDHTGVHREAILSEGTSRLMKARLSGEWIEHALVFGEQRTFQSTGVPFQLTLKPAGHVLGSAMAFIEQGGRSLLYTGDFKLRAGGSAEPCEPVRADVLIMETTYGRPVYRFPPVAEVVEGVVRFCREALDNEEIPVLLGYSLGKSQEILFALKEAGFDLMAHASVIKMNQVYRELGRELPECELFNPENAKGRVLLLPPNTANSASLRKLGRCRSAVLTGWAVDPNCRFRHRAHGAFALSDHADFPDLVEMVRRVGPKKIYTLHGFAAEFAQHLRELGFDAQALSEEDQLSLPLSFSPVPQPAAPSPSPALPPAAEVPVDGTSFARFAEVCAEVAKTSKKLEKVARLSAYLKGIDDAGAALASVWFSGHVFSPSQAKVLNLGWSLIRGALREVGGLDDAAFGQVYLKHSDLGETAYEILRANAHGAGRSLAQVSSGFEAIHRAAGPTVKHPLLVRLLKDCSALEGKFLVKILTGDLRIGLKEGLVEEAIAQASGLALDAVKDANLLLGNIGEVATLARHGQLDSIALIPFRPLKYMLASPEETAADIWARVSEWRAPKQPSVPGEAALPRLGVHTHQGGVWVEDKYDGIRCQVHKLGDTVVLYSRDLKDISLTFPEVVDGIRALPEDFIVDGEIVAMRGRQALPYSDLQKRLGRKEGDFFLGNEFPAQFIAFDLLWLAGETFLKEPLRARRLVLEKITAGGFRLAHVTEALSADEVEAAFTASRARGNEGLVVKDPEGAYTLGRRGNAWLKLKKAFATLDCVVVGAEYGLGRRKSVLSDYTFAVRDEKNGELKTIGKAYSGLTDIEIETLTRHFLRKVVSQNGRYHELEPDTVLEIAFDLLQASDRHSSGLAMRFPRIVRLRHDKTVKEIDTLATARAIAEKSKRLDEA